MEFIDKFREGNLVRATLQNLYETFNRLGLKPSHSSYHAFNQLADILVKGLTGKLDSSFYLSSLDPGVGKTQIICTFIQTWKQKGFKPSGSVLIAVSSKEQINDLVRRMSLDDGDYACLTSDNSINVLGLGKDHSRKAKVLFTTQQMILSRCGDKKAFDKESSFFYENGPRNLRIWDESYLPSEPVSISITNMMGLSGMLTYLANDLANKLAELGSGLTSDKVGQVFCIAKGLADLARKAKAALVASGTSLHKRQAYALESLIRAGGQELRLKDYGGSSSLTLVGHGRTIPADFAPAIILDASIRVRGTYALWEAAGAKVTRLDTVVNDYQNLRLRYWRTACGKGVLSNPDTNRSIFRNIAKAIETKPTEEWLIIAGMDDPYAIHKDEEEREKASTLGLIRRSLPEGIAATVRLSFVHWGRHMATNAYSHIKNVIVIGAWDYGNKGRDALAAASIGNLATTIPEDASEGLLASEYKHNLLQGLMRSNARNAKEGVCGECDAYVIVSTNTPITVFKENFPGCDLSAWIEKPRPLGQGKQRLLNALVAWSGKGVASVQKKTIVLEAGIDTNSLSKILSDRVFQEALAAKGISTNTRYFIFGDSDT